MSMGLERARLSSCVPDSELRAGYESLDLAGRFVARQPLLSRRRNERTVLVSWRRHTLHRLIQSVDFRALSDSSSSRKRFVKLVIMASTPAPITRRIANLLLAVQTETHNPRSCKASMLRRVARP